VSGEFASAQRDAPLGWSQRRWTAIASIIFALGALFLFFSAPHNGEFWWSDAPRHALNGVFLGDLVSAWPSDPKAWAIDYYVKHPALTILFYPPLFYVISAPFFLLFGVSHATALAVVELHYFALSLAIFFLSRRWVSPIASIAIGLSIMTAPGVALWGRQVMLEVPSLAFLVWSMVAFTHYLAARRSVFLYSAVLLLLAAVYTKINAGFVLPAFALALLAARGRDVFFGKHVWLSLSLLLIGLLPIVVLTLKFGGANVQSLVGISDSRVSRASIAGWVWYAVQLPQLIGWPLLLLAIATPVAALFRPDTFKLSLAEAVLLGVWFVSGYLVLSLIDLKEARHAVLLVPPLLISAGLATTIFRPRAWLSDLALLALVLGTGAYTLAAAPVPSVAGYRDAAKWVATHAPANAIVLFSGKRDGSFIFNLRTFANRIDISTIRIDKLLLTVSVRRTLGVAERPLSEVQIARMLDEDGVQYVVAQDDFWTDIPVMARFQNVLKSPHFAKLAVIAVIANVPSEDKAISIYKNLGQVNPHPKPLTMPLAIIGTTITGKAGK
jgi:Dolichyl-phosphate-mannose-protein mannosyltransferase